MLPLGKYEFAEFHISIFRQFLYFEVYSVIECISTNIFPQVECTWDSLGHSLILSELELFFHK